MIIGFCGRMQSGKTTAAQVLVEEFGFTRMSFADPIREMMADIDPVVGLDLEAGMPSEWIRYSEATDEYGYDDAKKEYPEIRRLMQAIGVSARERISEYAWVTALSGRISAPYQGENIVIDDVRFLNEAEMIRWPAFNGRIYRIERPGLPQSDHVSETEGDSIEVDATLKNSYDLDGFRDAVGSFFRGLM